MSISTLNYNYLQIKNWSVEDYEALYEQIKAGEIKIDNTVVSDPSTMNLEHITFVK